MTSTVELPLWLALAGGFISAWFLASRLPTAQFLGMAACKFTDYFVGDVLRKRPYLRKAWCEEVLRHPVRVERQPDGRYQFWGRVPELGGRYLRVVTLADRVTVHNAFPDRRFTP